MFDLKLIKEILLEKGLGSLNLKGLKLVRRILAEDEEDEFVRKIYATDIGVEVDKKMLLDYINYYGIDNLYVGERANHYSNRTLKLRNMRGASLLPDKDISGKKSLFKHDENDYYYYDLLDGERRCEHVSPDVFYIREGCDNMKSIASIIEKPKEKCKEMVE